MSNLITRALPIKAQEVKIMPSTQYRRKSFYYWYKNNKENILIVLGLTLFIILLSSIVYSVVHQRHEHLLAVATQHHYKHNEAAWCDQEKDDNRNDTLGWIPCTILQANDKRYTSYFVSYGNIQANIPADAIKEKKQ